MVWLCWLQDRDSMPNWYTINHPTTHNEIQWPTAARRWQFALRDVSRRQSCHLSTPNHPRVPPVWPYCWQAQCGRWRSLKWINSRPPDLKSSSYVSLPFAWITGPRKRTQLSDYLIIDYLFDYLFVGTSFQTLICNRSYSIWAGLLCWAWI